MFMYVDTDRGALACPRMAGDAELTIKYATVVGELRRGSRFTGSGDLAVDILLDSPSVPTEGKFFGFFNSDARSLRQHPAFHRFVLDSGLLDYWKK